MKATEEIQNNPAEFKNFHWLTKQARNKNQLHAVFIETTLDVARGIELCLQIVNRDGIDRESGNEPFFKSTDVFKLLMLAQRSAQMLADQTEDHIDHLNDLAGGRP